MAEAVQLTLLLEQGQTGRGLVLTTHPANYVCRDIDSAKRQSKHDCESKENNPRDSTSRWLKEKTQVTEDTVQEVDVAAKEGMPETLHPMCLKRHPNLELARTLRVTSSPLAQETRAKMGTYLSV
jgi:hypothetical protein